MNVNPYTRLNNASRELAIALSRETAETKLVAIGREACEALAHYASITGGRFGSILNKRSDHTSRSLDSGINRRALLRLQSTLNGIIRPNTVR